jgi:hypothetical protein
MGRWLALLRGPLAFLGCELEEGDAVAAIVKGGLCGQMLDGTAALQLHSIKRAAAVYRCFSRHLGTLQTNTCAL